MSYLDCLEHWKQFISESDLLSRRPFSLTKLGAPAQIKGCGGGQGSGLDKCLDLEQLTPGDWTFLRALVLNWNLPVVLLVKE